MIDAMVTTALWVTAHPDPHSLTSELGNTGVRALGDSGITTFVSDLYAMNWNPLLGDSDFGPGDARDEPISRRQKYATAQATLASDIRREQGKITAADLVVVQFPLWWYGMPAILKGWFDRVFTNGFAFGVRDDAGRIRKYGDGALTGKALLAVVAAGDRASSLGPRGISGDLVDTLWPLLHGTAHYTGMRPLRPHLVASADRVDDTLIESERSRLRRRLAGIGSESAVEYRTLRSGDYDADHVLLPDVSPATPGLCAHHLPAVRTEETTVANLSGR